MVGESNSISSISTSNPSISSFSTSNPSISNPKYRIQAEKEQQRLQRLFTQVFQRDVQVSFNDDCVRGVSRA